MHERIENALNEYGELMVRMASGAEHELHLHNTQFMDDHVIKVDGEDETHWLDTEQIERYWIHQDF